MHADFISERSILQFDASLKLMKKALSVHVNFLISIIKNNTHQMRALFTIVPILYFFWKELLKFKRKKHGLSTWFFTFSSSAF